MRLKKTFKCSEARRARERERYYEQREKRKAQRRAYYKAHREEILMQNHTPEARAIGVLHTKEPKRHAQRGLKNAKDRAKKYGRVCTITLDDIKIPVDCPVFHTPLVRDGLIVGHPSIDRIDSNGGYTPENVRVISWRANTLKNNATREESQLLAIDASRLSEREVAGYAEYGWL